MSSRLQRHAKFVILVIALIIPSSFNLSCSQSEHFNQVDSLTVAWSPFEQDTLLWIAEDQGFFETNNLSVTLRKYDTGVGSLDGVLNGEADIALGVTEFPIVSRVFQKTDARIFSTIAKIEQQYLVARKDKGIEIISDLKGKTIGTTFRTVAEFYLGRFLELNSVERQDVTIADLRTPSEWENSVADGLVDAIVTAQPYADLAVKRLNGNAIMWPVQGGQYIYGLVVSSKDWITKNPETASKFLSALIQADDFAFKNPAQAKTTVQKWLNVDAAFAQSTWSRDHFLLSLEQSLVTAMEDQARWMITNKLTNEKQVPNFTDYIFEDALKILKPSAVNIIR